jgi:putative ABC transport system permease protein
VSVSSLPLCVRELRRHPLRSALTMLGVVVGVASVVAMVTLGRGASAKVTQEIESLGTNLLVVLPKAPAFAESGGAQPLRPEDAAAILRELPAIRSVAPSQNATLELVAGSKRFPVGVVGTTLAYFSARGYTLMRGELFSAAQARSASPICVLGASVVRELEREGASTRRVRVGGLSCQVIGVLKAKGQSGLGDDPDNIVVLPLGTMRQRITGTDALQGLLVSAQAGHSTASVKRSVEALLRERHGSVTGQADDFSVQDMQELMGTLTTITTVLSALLSVIAGVSLLVGGIGIMNIMLVSVTERTNEIGMRLAIGATEHDVLQQFLLEAVLLSTIGGLVGVVVGAGASWLACLMLAVPFVVRLDIVAVALTVSLVVGLIFGILPARRAARLHPVEALRHL